MHWWHVELCIGAFHMLLTLQCLMRSNTCWGQEVSPCTLYHGTWELLSRRASAVGSIYSGPQMRPYQPSLLWLVAIAWDTLSEFIDEGNKCGFWHNVTGADFHNILVCVGTAKYTGHQHILWFTVCLSYILCVKYSFPLTILLLVLITSTKWLSDW